MEENRGRASRNVYKGHMGKPKGVGLRWKARMGGAGGHCGGEMETTILKQQQISK